MRLRLPAPLLPAPLLVAALLVAALAACADGTSPPPPPAPIHDLLFVARARGFDELVILPLAGGTPQRLLAFEATAHHPAPSPDGRHVAYVDLGDDEIWIAGRDGARVRNVSQHAPAFDAMPAWSPDGTRLAFTSDRSGGGDVYVVRADGTGLVNLVTDAPAAMPDESPAWSPDGSRIAYSSSRDGTGHRHIWTMRADGSDVRRVTNDPLARDHEPSWSPDGRRIVFRRQHATSPDLVDLAIVTVDDGAVTTLPLPGRERTPSWSPDGALIAFASDAGGPDLRLLTVRPDGRDLVTRAAGPAIGHYAAHPRWIRRP